MRLYQRLFGTAFLMAAFFALPFMEALGQNAKKKDPAPVAGTPTDSGKLAPGAFEGILKSTPGSDRTFTVDVEIVKMVPAGAKGGAVKGNGGKGGNNNGPQKILQMQNQLQQAEAQALRATSPQQRQQAMGKIRQLTNQIQQAALQSQRSGNGAPPGFRYEKSKVAVEFQGSDKVKVRTIVLPETFDDKGNLKKYSTKELEDLRGKDKSAPGYESALEKLEVGQRVRIITAAVAPTKGVKTKDKDADDELSAEKSRQATLILVTAPADPSVAKGAAPPKKKK